MKFYIHNVDIDIPMEQYASELARFGFRKVTKEERTLIPTNYICPADYIIELNSLEDFDILIDTVGDIVIREPYLNMFGDYVTNEAGDERIRTIIIYDGYLE